MAVGKDAATQRLCLTIGFAVVLLSGCRSNVALTNTSETGSQQLLLNSSADLAISSLDYSPLASRKCYLDTSGLGSKSSGYLPYRIRQQMIGSGIRLVDGKDDADVIVEAGLSAYGTDSQSDELGIFDASSLPDIHLYSRNLQYGVVKLSMFAWEKETGSIVWDTCQMRADSYQENQQLLGIGPVYSGTIQHPANRVFRQ